MGESVLQIKSRQRVLDYGEVFTAEREVNAMLDLVKEESYKIDSRFLEPSCGNGNFLIEVLRRKLSSVQSAYKNNKLKYEINSIAAISSIYGLEILEDNVIDCRDRLYNYLDKQYTSIFKHKCNGDFRKAVKFILERNIILGNTLTMKSVCGKEKDIILSEWSILKDHTIKRSDYKIQDLLNEPTLKDKIKISKQDKQIITHSPIKIFAPIHYLRIRENV